MLIPPSSANLPGTSGVLSSKPATKNPHPCGNTGRDAHNLAEADHVQILYHFGLLHAIGGYFLLGKDA